MQCSAVECARLFAFILLGERGKEKDTENKAAAINKKRRPPEKKKTGRIMRAVSHTYTHTQKKRNGSKSKL